jgi:type IV pilus assembly protein PilV
MKKIAGFTLIETMIAIVVFSFGLLAIAGVMTVAVKSNHNGYMRSQASFLASSMLDTMRRNIRAVWAGSYDGTVSGYSDVNSMCQSAGCTFNQLAARDLQFWSNTITQILPNSTGEISCVAGSAFLDTAGPINAPFYAVEPYSGICTITVNWTESNETAGDSTQSLVLQGKP